VPKRTNLFQEVVEIIHRHMADGATVEASAYLPSQRTGSDREVDVVIRGEQAGHEVIVSVEAMARSRKADRMGRAKSRAATRYLSSPRKTRVGVRSRFAYARSTRQRLKIPNLTQI
jgi:hypothetical protein